jgi:GrpB-like predicted nucleotidyltransferase (UPF0157 family)
MMFVRGYTPGGFRGQAFHLHLRYPGIQDEILLRDLLRTDPDLAQAYVVLKTRLAKRFRNDREAYTEGKTDFVARVLKTAEKTSSDRTG